MQQYLKGHQLKWKVQFRLYLPELSIHLSWYVLVNIKVNCWEIKSYLLTFNHPNFFHFTCSTGPRKKLDNNCFNVSISFLMVSKWKKFMVHYKNATFLSIRSFLFPFSTYRSFFHVFFLILFKKAFVGRNKNDQFFYY